MIVTWFCNASVAVETESEKMLFDPYIPGENFDPAEYEGFHTVFLTNENPACLKDIPSLIQNEADIYCNEGAQAELLKMGADGNYIHVLEPGDTQEFQNLTVQAFDGPEYTQFAPENTGLSGRINQFLSHFRRENLRKTYVYSLKTEDKEILILPGQTLPENKVYPMQPDLMILPYCGKQNEALELFRWIKPSKILLHSWDSSDPGVIKADTKSLKLLMKQECPDIAVAKPLNTRSYAL